MFTPLYLSGIPSSSSDNLRRTAVEQQQEGHKYLKKESELEKQTKKSCNNTADDTLWDSNRFEQVWNCSDKHGKKTLGHLRRIWVPESPGASPAAPSWSAECPPAVTRSSGLPSFSTA